MVDEVVVAEPHVLEVDAGVDEIGEAAADADGEGRGACVGAGGLHAAVDYLGGEEVLLAGGAHG